MPGVGLFQPDHQTAANGFIRSRDHSRSHAGRWCSYVIKTKKAVTWVGGGIKDKSIRSFKMNNLVLEKTFYLYVCS